MTLRAISEALQIKHPGIPLQALIGLVGRGFNQIIYEVFRQDMSNLDLYCRTFPNVEILFDEETNQWYSNLPEQIVQLPDQAEGVRWILPMKGRVNMFVPVTKEGWNVHDDMPVTPYDTSVSYSPTNRRVEYDREPPVKTVKMGLVIPIEKYGANEEINIPAGQDVRLLEVVDMYIQNPPPVDKSNT
jgi:hypothetical protein